MDAAVPVAKLLFAGDVVDGQHGARVRDLGKAFFGFAADTLRGGVGRDEGRVFTLEALKLSHEVIELGVGDCRLVQHVVKVLVVADLVAEGGDPFGGVGIGGRGGVGHRLSG